MVGCGKGRSFFSILCAISNRRLSLRCLPRSFRLLSSIVLDRISFVFSSSDSKKRRGTPMAKVRAGGRGDFQISEKKCRCLSKGIMS